MPSTTMDVSPATDAEARTALDAWTDATPLIVHDDAEVERMRQVLDGFLAGRNPTMDLYECVRHVLRAYNKEDAGLVSGHFIVYATRRRVSVSDMQRGLDAACKQELVVWADNSWRLTAEGTRLRQSVIDAAPA